MWTVIYMANTRKDADKVQQILIQEGFLVKVKPISKNNIEGTCEVLVPRTEAEEVHSILIQLGL